MQISYDKVRDFVIKQHPEIAIICLLWCLVHLLGFIFKLLFPYTHEYAGFPWISEDASIYSYFYNITQTWDSIHFSRLATQWYSPVDHIGNKDYLYAFFPLYPALLWFINLFIGNITVTMTLISLVLPCIAAVLLRQFYAKYLDKANSLLLTCLSFLLPFGLFYIVPYTESLYLILSILVLGYTLKKIPFKYDWLTGIVLGLSLVLTRSVGLLLVGSLLGVLLLNTLYSTFFLRKQVSTQFRQMLVRASWLVFGAVAGILLFFVHNWMRTGNFGVSRSVQDYFGRGNTLNPLSPFIRGFEQTVSGERLSRGIFFVPVILGYFGYLAWKWRRSTEFGWLVFAGFLYSLTTTYLNITADSLASTNRYMLTSPLYYLFTPLFITEVWKGKKWLQYTAWILLFTVFIYTIYIFTRQLWLG